MGKNSKKSKILSGKIVRFLLISYGMTLKSFCHSDKTKITQKQANRGIKDRVMCDRKRHTIARTNRQSI